MNVEEFMEEDGTEVVLKDLEGEFMATEDYSKAHANIVIAYHDIYLEYDNGILLVNRDIVPAKNELFPIGGRILKGVKLLDSLEIKVMEECGLKVTDMEYLDTTRELWRTDPFGHGKGTDCISLAFKGIGHGDLNLNELHSSPVIVTRDNYDIIRKTLHPYVQKFMDELNR